MTVWRSFLSILGVAAHPAGELRREFMSQYEAKMTKLSHDARSVEASALARAIRFENDPHRDEMKLLNSERQDTIDAFIKGRSQ